MSKKKIVEIPLSKLQVTFFVRRELNEDRVVHLAELYESGADIPPLLVAAAAKDKDTYDVLDGRHRKAALELLNRTEAQCTIVDAADRVELMGVGFKANIGGPLTLSRWDIISMMRQLIENGGTQKRIVAMLSDIYKPSLCRKYLKDAFSEIHKAKLQKAVNAVVNEALTVPVAAERFGVEVERLKDEIQGKKRKRKGVHVAEIKAALSQRYKGNTFKTYSLVRGLVEQYEDGELAEKQVEEVFDHVEHLLKRGLRSYKEWRHRFETLTHGGGLEPEASEKKVQQPKPKESNSGAKATLRKMGLA